MAEVNFTATAPPAPGNEWLRPNLTKIMPVMVNPSALEDIRFVMRTWPTPVLNSRGIPQ